ncbi:hypothetical protein NE857_02020 [Nocardiopsis exhalans]|uniref:Uncharacterized protein n=1 Tax=Nocardiopsis exhalans TaxID=163604 RepID=A0ABY5D7X4_9ACTN|nr:hypothetical protein [Nocardiopsis exhalans]USY20461.1 hypothetical protein NE857_02020 [Nocardiopsis exhalans]
MSPTPDERARIRSAMERILASTPERSNGALTIVALAQEADVPRNALTQRHTDIRNEFYEAIRSRGETPEVETRLRRKVTELKKTITNKRNRIKQLESDLEGLLAHNTILTLQNQELRDALSGAKTNVIPIRPTTGEQP